MRPDSKESRRLVICLGPVVRGWAECPMPAEAVTDAAGLAIDLSASEEDTQMRAAP